MQQNKKFLLVAREWLELKKMSVKYSSYVKYETVILKHVVPFFDNYTLEQITDEIIISFFKNLIEIEKYSNSTLHAIRYVMKAILEYAEKKYSIKTINFSFIKLNRTKVNFKILDENQKESLERYCFTHYKPISIAILIALYGGLRIGEICALTWHDIDLNNGIIAVNKTVERLKNKETTDSKTLLMILEPKTHTSKRIVPIPSFLKEYLYNYYHNSTISNKSFYLLTNGEKIPDPRTIQNQFQRLCQDYNFQTNFHSLRHTYATRCVMQEVDLKSLSEMLGHSNVSTTLQLYVHSSLEFKMDQINKISAPVISQN
ncbi:tyrosine-type recombinase/integrase [Thomasclavelia saccharogumia]|uniref:tyrosine-type recombinase/integrase n=1 Tax=Thomasclavelia saccharogumia TaxID=341225 RepID=UPI00047B1BB8|nr:site-specific integrase [Thomasclavelia saccharogumia]